VGLAGQRRGARRAGAQRGEALAGGPAHQAGEAGREGARDWAWEKGEGAGWLRRWLGLGPDWAERGEGRRGRLGRPGKEIERAEGRGVRGLGLEPSWAGFFWVLG
jgi:hypothetical protein